MNASLGERSPRRRGCCHRGARQWLGLEGFVLLAGALIAFGVLGQPWWLVPGRSSSPASPRPATWPGPSRRPHVQPRARRPLARRQLGAGDWQAGRPAEALALVWLAHIGPDQLPGVGLKYGDRCTHTHLGDRPDAR